MADVRHSEGSEKRVTAVDDSEIPRHAANDLAAIPKGTLDPVYEAKARVLNHAVSVPLYLEEVTLLTKDRSKILEWAGINGSSSSLWALAGQTIISGPS